MIDLWAGIDATNAPFADITWMFFYGGTPKKEILHTFDIVKQARNSSLSYIKKSL